LLADAKVDHGLSPDAAEGGSARDDWLTGVLRDQPDKRQLRKFPVKTAELSRGCGIEARDRSDRAMCPAGGECVARARLAVGDPSRTAGRQAALPGERWRILLHHSHLRSTAVAIPRSCRHLRNAHIWTILVKLSIQEHGDAGYR